MLNSQTLHLRVIQNVLAEDREPSQLGAICNPQRTEVVWNYTYTAFRMVSLKWWDDASYAAYQARDIEDDRFEEHDFEGVAPVVASPDFQASNDPDDILF